MSKVVQMNNNVALLSRRGAGGREGVEKEKNTDKLFHSCSPMLCLVLCWYTSPWQLIVGTGGWGSGALKAVGRRGQVEEGCLGRGAVHLLAEPR